MDLLIALMVFAVGFMTFGSLVYGAAKIFLHRKMNDQGMGKAAQRSASPRVNKSSNIYSFK